MNHRVLRTEYIQSSVLLRKNEWWTTPKKNAPIKNNPNGPRPRTPSLTGGVKPFSKVLLPGFAAGFPEMAVEVIGP
jgi:hypothetical protein